MEYITSGNSMVDAMGMMNISGNVIPQLWYSTITRPNGKPYLLAITLLSDIVYWYRPTEVRDEQSGRVVGWKKRFKGEMLQKTYQQYAELYGESKRSVKAALDRLEELGIIRKEFHDIPYENGIIIYNVMYIALNTDILRKFTYSENALEMEEEQEANKEDKEEQHNTEGCSTYIQNDVGGGTKFCMGSEEVEEKKVEMAGEDTTKCTTLLQNFVPPHTTECKTNTEINTENTNRDYINSIYPINLYTGASSEKIDEMDRNDKIDKVATYTNIIKQNIEYEILKTDRGYNVQMLDEILELLVEIVSVEREYMRINGADYPYQLVKSKLLKLGYEHIRYVMDCMEKNTTKIENIRAYLLTALFNAPNTMNNYYQSKVNYDMYRKGFYGDSSPQN